jgi:hypothetical protein
LAPALEAAGLRVRAISFDVRQALQLPDPKDARFSVFAGTGGPGHIDPRLNDGCDPNAQGVAENPAWETPLFRLFDSIVERTTRPCSPCATIRPDVPRLQVADPVARGPEKGGKSEGIRDNLLTDAARKPSGLRLVRAAASQWRPAARPRQPDLRPDPA